MEYLNSEDKRSFLSSEVSFHFSILLVPSLPRIQNPATSIPDPNSPSTATARNNPEALAQHSHETLSWMVISVVTRNSSKVTWQVTLVPWCQGCEMMATSDKGPVSGLKETRVSYVQNKIRVSLQLQGKYTLPPFFLACLRFREHLLV